jgi:predicted GIY-YIG superfamily endonuclease
MVAIQSQHQAAVDEVKSTLDLSNPINVVITKVDDPTEDSEILIHWLNEQSISCMVQSIDKHVDVSKIQKAHISKETKDEAIAWKCNKAAEKVIWINRKQFGDAIGIDGKLRDWLRDKSHPIISTNDVKIIKGGEDASSLIMLGYRIKQDPRKEEIFFPSTLLLDIFKTYSGKSHKCNELELILSNAKGIAHVMYYNNIERIDKQRQKRAFIYVMTSDIHMQYNEYKIGFTRNLDDRLSAHQTSYPLFYFKDYFETINGIKSERKIHKKLEAYNIKNEWFRCSDYKKLLRSIHMYI